MTWVRLDENIPHHPKLLSVSPQAAWLFVCCLAYCNRLLTDGAIPQNALKHISPTSRRPLTDMSTLVHSRLIDISPTGWMIHDYLKYQPSAETIRAQRAATAARVAAHRIRRNAPVTPLQQDGNAVTPTTCNAPPVRSGPVSSVEQKKKTSGAVLTDDAFIAMLKANPAYEGIDIDREDGKMDAWLLTPRGRGKKKTRGFFVNWLNRAERTMSPNGPAPQPSRPYGINTGPPPTPKDQLIDVHNLEQYRKAKP